jgi:hypothetical protein
LHSISRFAGIGWELRPFEEIVPWHLSFLKAEVFLVLIFY